MNFKNPMHVLKPYRAAFGFVWEISSSFSFFLNLILFLAALGLRCCARAFSSCGERGLLFLAVLGLLIAVASFVVEHRL